MRKPIAAVINWFGPYTYEDALKAAKSDFDDGLYFFIGRQQYEKKDKLKYIGIANDLYKRLLEQRRLADEKIGQICKVWLGESTTTGIPGKKIGNKSPIIDLSESAHIYFLQPEINYSKAINPPKSEITVLNRWWYPNYKTPRMTSPHPDWADIINYYGMDEEAQVIYLKRVTGRIKRIKPEDI